LIVGYGAVGRRVARLAKAFDARVVGVNRHGGAQEWADEMRTPAVWRRRFHTLTSQYSRCRSMRRPAGSWTAAFLPA